MTRQTDAFSSIQTGLSELSHLKDAYDELADIVRRFANGDPTASLDSNTVLRQHIARGFLHSTFYTPYSASIDPVLATVIYVISDQNPPPGIFPVHWEARLEMRMQLRQLCEENVDKAKHAVEKTVASGWFVGQMIKQRPATSPRLALDICTHVFTEAHRRCAA